MTTQGSPEEPPIPHQNSDPAPIPPDYTGNFGLIQRCSRFRRSSSRTPDALALTLVLRTLARRVQAATVEAAELEAEILAHVRALVPQLLDEPGVGPIVAAQVIVTWSHKGRVRSEAAFA